MRNKSQECSESAVQVVRDGLREIHEKTQSWRMTGYAIGVSGAYARLLVMGKRDITGQIVSAWRKWETSKDEEYESVVVCPTCLAQGRREVHAAGDCHGLPVVSVICLAPGERVRKPHKPAEKWIDFSVSALRQAILQRLPYKNQA